jgi:hypothetical protein
VRDAGAWNGQVLEVACDESGYEGERLIGVATDVFAHGSVLLAMEPAQRCMRELRDRIRSPATEYKANHLLREKHRSVLKWLLEASGPLHGNARAYLVDKAFFVTAKVVDLLLDEDSPPATVGLRPVSTARAMAVTLYHEGRRAFGRDGWEAFLVASNNLMRGKDRLDVRTPVDSFFQRLDALKGDHTGEIDAILDLLRGARARADCFRARLRDDPTMIPAVDPLIPAIVRAVVRWGGGQRPVSIVHDQQNMLSAIRIAQLTEILGDSSSGGLTRLRLVASQSDERVQVADILAGVARKIASDELNHRGDAELTELLRPYVDPASVWDDERSWA